MQWPGWAERSTQHIDKPENFLHCLYFIISLVVLFEVKVVWNFMKILIIRINLQASEGEDQKNRRKKVIESSLEQLPKIPQVPTNTTTCAHYAKPKIHN